MGLLYIILALCSVTAVAGAAWCFLSWVGSHFTPQAARAREVRRSIAEAERDRQRRARRSRRNERLEREWRRDFEHARKEIAEREERDRELSELGRHFRV